MQQCGKLESSEKTGKRRGQDDAITIMFIATIGTINLAE